VFRVVQLHAMTTALSSCAATLLSPHAELPHLGRQSRRQVLAISPSWVLHTQSLRENFCRTPARSPSEYAHDNVSQLDRPIPAITATMRIVRTRIPRRGELRRTKVGNFDARHAGNLALSRMCVEISGIRRCIKFALDE